MVKVYFESDSHAELVAVFADEKTFDACYHTLQEEAFALGMILTESIDTENTIDRYEP